MPPPPPKKKKSQTLELRIHVQLLASMCLWLKVIPTGNDREGFYMFFVRPFYTVKHCPSKHLVICLLCVSIQEKVCRLPKGFVRNGNERERGGGGSGRGHERRARKRTGWKVDIESKTQVCWLTSVLAIDVHENALTAQDTSVSRIHLSSARLEKSDAWPAGGHSFYDESWTPANCHVRALTWAQTTLISARQSHLLHLQSPLFGYVPRSGGENVKETAWTNQHTSPGGEGKEEEGREEKRGEGRVYSVSLRRKTGQTEAGWVEGSINSFAAAAPTLKNPAEDPRNNVNLLNF